MFLAHFYGWRPAEMMEMTSKDLFYWVVEGKKLYEKLNPYPAAVYMTEGPK